MKAAIGGVVVLQLATAGCVTDDRVDATGTSVEALQKLQNAKLPNNFPVFDSAGVGTTDSTNKNIDLSNEFFQDLGTNGRRCVSCHLPTAGWTTTPEQIQTVFALTRGGELDDGIGLGA